jgi:hypothetical protein
MVGSRCISYEESHQRICRDNFKEKLRPVEKEKPEEPIHYDLEFSEIIQQKM